MSGKIFGGYIILARCIQDSEISMAPPCVREVWSWLLKEANHKPKMYAGFFVQRGQCFRSTSDLRDGLKWMVGYREMRYSEADIKNAMKWLRTHLMITTTKAPRGSLITICNYETYQNPANYESTYERT